MRFLLALCILAAGAPLLASAQFYCMTGVPCGNGCTMGDGLCINGRCFDRTGTLEWECMTPMRSMTPFRLQDKDSTTDTTTTQTQAPATAAAGASAAAGSSAAAGGPWDQYPNQYYYGASWFPRMPTWQPWAFPSFPRFQPWRPFMPWAPMQMGPMFGDCGGKGPCEQGSFCDAQGVCRKDDCVSQFKYGCPDDKGELKKVACPHFSGFKECYTSSSGGFKCFKGPSGSSLSCASQNSNGFSSGAVWTAGGGFQAPLFPDLDDDVVEAPATPVPAATATPVPSATATPVPAKATPAPATATPAAATAMAASASSSDGSSKSAFKKVVTEAGPAQTAAIATAQQKQLAGSRPTLMVDAAESADATNQMPPMTRMAPMFTSDGSMLTAAGPGPAIGMMDVDPNSGGVAAGMAAGDDKTVMTRRGPDGSMSSMSSSVSRNGGPAIASSVAVSNGQPMPQQPERDSPVTTGPSTAQPAVQPGSAAGAQPVSSRDGTTGTTPAGADAAKSTRVKSSAGGLRGASSSLLLFQGLVTCALAVLLL